jgi:hypothetical protein
LAETVWEKQTLVKRVERDDFSNRLEIVRLERERDELDEQLAKRNEVVSTLTEQSSQVCSCHHICLSLYLSSTNPHSAKVDSSATRSDRKREGEGSRCGPGKNRRKDEV